MRGEPTIRPEGSRVSNKPPRLGKFYTGKQQIDTSSTKVDVMYDSDNDVNGDDGSSDEEHVRTKKSIADERARMIPGRRSMLQPGEVEQESEDDAHHDNANDSSKTINSNPGAQRTDNRPSSQGSTQELMADSTSAESTIKKAVATKKAQLLMLRKRGSTSSKQSSTPHQKSLTDTSEETKENNSALFLNGSNETRRRISCMAYLQIIKQGSSITRIC